MRLRVAPSAAAVLPPRSATQAQSPRHAPQAISPPRCLSSPHPPFFLRRRIRRLSTPKNPSLVPTHPSLVRLSGKSGLSHSQSPPHPLLPSVSSRRRIRRSAPPPHPFPVAAASVARRQPIRSQSPPHPSHCPTTHPFPVAAASVALPRHPIRPNPPPAPSAACPRSRIRRGSPPPVPPPHTHTPLPPHLSLVLCRVRLFSPLSQFLFPAASGRLTCPPPSLFACFAVSCKSAACPHRLSSASRPARSPPVPPAASVACPRRIRRPSPVSLPCRAAATRQAALLLPYHSAVSSL